MDTDQKVIWLSHLLNDLGYFQRRVTPMYEENRACIEIAKNDMVQTRAKHVEIRFQFLRQVVKSGEVKLIYCHSKLMLTDTLKKALSEVKLAKFDTSILIQDKRLDQSGKVEDQASACKPKANRRVWINTHKQEVIEKLRQL